MGEEPNYVAGATTQLEIKIDHPANGVDLDQLFTQTYKRTVTANGMPNLTALYALAYGFDVSQESLRRRERMLENYKAAGKADTSREVLGETLNFVGQQWYLQTELVGRMLSNLTGCAHQSHHRIGRIAQEEGVYIDVMGQVTGSISRTGNAADPNTLFTTESFYWSAMEHGILDQLQGLSAASTVNLLSRANALAHKIFVVRNIGEYNAIQAQLTSYSTAQKAEIQAKINLGATVVLPANGDLRIKTTDAWHGTGYVLASPTEIGMIISGGYNGGYAGIPYQTQPFRAQETYQTAISMVTTQTYGFRVGSDEPVDLATGLYYTTPHSDLAVGSSLALMRNYEAGRRTQDIAGLGYGWTHSGHLRLSERTSVENGLGLRSAPDMAATLCSAVVVLDLFRTRAVGNDFQKKWVGSLMAANWAVNQLKNNSVSVQLPDKHLEFTRQPDGSYTNPPGMPVVLAKNTTTNTFTVTPRNSGTTTFEAIPSSTGNYRIKNSVDLWSRTQNFTYDATSGKLTKITDPYSRSLNFIYTDSRLTTVTDSTGRSITYAYDSTGNLLSYTDPEGKKDNYLYDDKHRITELKDHTGRSLIKNFYDAQHRVVEQHNQSLADRVWTYAYAPGVTRETDPSGAVIQHLFDDRSRSTGRIDPLGHRQRIGYDGRDHQTTSISPLGRTTASVYDANDNLISQTDPTGAITTITYDAQHRPATSTDPLNRVTTSTYNAKHQVVTTTNHLNETTTNVYDPTTGYLTSTTNHIGHSTSYQYDTYGQLKKTTLPGGLVVEQFTNARGDVEWSKDARGIQTAYTYNRRRETLSSTTGNRTVRTAYNDNRMAASSTNARGFTTTTTYTSTGKPLTTTAPDGSSTSNTYDARELVVSTTGPSGEVSQTLYEPLLRPQTTIDPLGRSVTVQYDADGMPQWQLAPLNRNTYTAYQIAPGQPRLVTTANPLGHTTVSQYDAAGQQRYLTNRNGQTFQLNYDDLGRPTSTIQPGGRTHAIGYSWNATGQVQTLTEPSGQTTTLQHNALGQVITRTDADGAISYTYDPNGNVLTVTEGGQTITRTYEPDRNLVSTYTNTAGETIAYAYDKNDNLITLTYPGGKAVHYAYDSNDRLISLTDWAGRFTSFEYDASSRMVAIKRPNGTVRRMVYDPAGQLSGFTEIAPNGSAIAHQSWQYDAGGRPTDRQRIPGATAFTSPSFTATYHPDNRLATITPQGSAATPVTSDADGNLLTASLWEPARLWTANIFIWDARNRLQTLNTQLSSVNYVYDAEGHLIKRTENAQTTRYTVNPQSKLSQVLITHHTDGRKTYHIYAAGLVYEETFDASNQSQGTRTYHYDQIGSTIALSNDAGAVTGRLEYTAYGLTSHTNGNVDTAFHYNGRFGVMTDEITGLLYMRARWYSPSLGRFLNEDPIRFEGGLNWYAYAGGDPILLMDPLGLFDLDPRNWPQNAINWIDSIDWLPHSIGLVAQGNATLGASPPLAHGHAEVAAGFGTFTQEYAGAYVTGGGAATWGSNEVSLPKASPNDASPTNFGYGAYAGLGAAVWFSNARTSSDIAKTVSTYSFNVDFFVQLGGISVSTGNGIWQVAVAPPVAGKGMGIDLTRQQTTTVTVSAGATGWANPSPVNTHSSRSTTRYK